MLQENIRKQVGQNEILPKGKIQETAIRNKHSKKMEITVSKYHPYSFIKTVAKQLNTISERDCLEERINLPQKIGTGKIFGFSFRNGPGIIIFDCILKQGLILKMKSELLSPLQFNFSVEGKVRHNFQNGSLRYQLGSLQSSITAATDGSLQSFAFPQNKRITFAILVVNRKKYLPIAECHFSKMNQKLAEAFKDVGSKNTFFYQSDFSIAVSRSIKKIILDKHSGLARSIYIESLVLELLSKQIKRVEDNLSMLGRQLKLSKYDLEKIKLARKTLVADLQNPPLIEDLARKVGVNQQKLKSGFKLVYETTINKYLTKKRLEQASLLILEGKSIRETGISVGYSNISHFAKKFKERYGVLPKDYMKSVQKKVQLQN